MSTAARTSTNGKPSRRAQPRRRSRPQFWELRLYVAGQTPRSTRALQNLKAFCEENLPNRYRIEVIDLLKNPQLAAGDQIVAIPTLVRKLPTPIRRIIGDMSNTDRLLVGLQLVKGGPG